MKQTDDVKKPFFVKFLECQQVADLQNEFTNPLKDPHTNKYPSDGDDIPPPIE